MFNLYPAGNQEIETLRQAIRMAIMQGGSEEILKSVLGQGNASKNLEALRDDAMELTKLQHLKALIDENKRLEALRDEARMFIMHGGAAALKSVLGEGDALQNLEALRNHAMEATNLQRIKTLIDESKRLDTLRHDAQMFVMHCTNAELLRSLLGEANNSSPSQKLDALKGSENELMLLQQIEQLSIQSRELTLLRQEVGGLVMSVDIAKLNPVLGGDNNVSPSIRLTALQGSPNELIILKAIKQLDLENTADNNNKNRQRNSN
jgi:hypothetical protein